jgi:hypothetical protein
LKVRPHLTDRDAALESDDLVARQRRDLDLLQEHAPAFLRTCRDATEVLGVRVAVLCNVDTREVLPTPLDWNGVENVHGLEPEVYRAGREALRHGDPRQDVVVLLCRPAEGTVHVYSLLDAGDSQEG